MARSGTCSRSLRAVMFAAVCVLLAAAGHVHASGEPVSPVALGGALALTTAGAWALTRRQRAVGAVTTAAVAVQALLHGVFVIDQIRGGTSGGQSGGPGAPHVSGAAASAATASAVHLQAHHAHHAPVAEPVEALAHGGHGTASMTAAMLLAHLAAAVLSGLWLAHGERAVFRLLRLIAAWLGTPLRLLSRPRAVRDRQEHRPPPWAAHRVSRSRLLRHDLPTRAPPGLTAVR